MTLPSSWNQLDESRSVILQRMLNAAKSENGRIRKELGRLKSPAPAPPPPAYPRLRSFVDAFFWELTVPACLMIILGVLL